MSESGHQSQHRYLEMDADQALFGQKPSSSLDAMIATFHENERPLRGLAGLLDWRFHGAISHFLRVGAISGKIGECAYLPLCRPAGTYHLLLIGAGPSRTPGERQALDETSLSVLKKNIASLRLERLGLSRSDFGDPPPKYFSTELKGLPLWIVL